MKTKEAYHQFITRWLRIHAQLKREREKDYAMNYSVHYKKEQKLYKFNDAIYESIASIQNGNLVTTS